MRFWFPISGVQTPTEIAELSIRTPRLMAIYLCKSEVTATRFYLCESNNNSRLSDQHYVLTQRQLQLRRGENDLNHFPCFFGICKMPFRYSA